jgi:toluene monooxygenase system protein B
MADFPLHSNFQGDFVPQLVLVDSEDTMDQVAEKCAYHSVGRRVAPQPTKILRVRRHRAAECYPRGMKVADSGLRPTETIDVIFADA